MTARCARRFGLLAGLGLVLLALAQHARAQDEDVLSDIADDDEREDTDVAVAAPDSAPETEQEQTQAEPGEGNSEDGYDEGGYDETEASSNELTPAGDEARALAFRAALGLGMGTLSFTRPTAEGLQRLGETPFGAAGIDLTLSFMPRETLSFDVLFAYQSSIGLALRVEPLFALPERVSVRYQRMELSAAPVIGLGDSAQSLAIAVPVGIAYRAFVSETHEYARLEQYVLMGPFLRAELLAWLGERVKLRLGPEIQWIAYVDADFASGASCCQGIAAAGQGAIEARVGPNLSVALTYREAHAFVSSSRRFEDVERWLVAQVAGAF